jgi:hypothetical protein
MQFHLISYIDNIVKNWSVRVKKLKKYPHVYIRIKKQENAKKIQKISIRYISVSLQIICIKKRNLTKEL